MPARHAEITVNDRLRMYFDKERLGWTWALSIGGEGASGWAPTFSLALRFASRRGLGLLFPREGR